MPKVKMFTTAAGPDGNFAAGETYAMSAEAAKAFVESGSAEIVEEPKKKAAAKEETEEKTEPAEKPETAATSAPETATAAPQRTRPRSPAKK